MATVRQSIEIQARFEGSDEVWDHFVSWVLVGSRRLACDELACIGAASSGAVALQPLTAERTRVTAEVALDDPALEELTVHKLRSDLLLFKHYVESGEYLRSSEHEGVARDRLGRTRRKRAEPPPPGLGDAAARRQVAGFGDS